MTISQVDVERMRLVMALGLEPDGQKYGERTRKSSLAVNAGGVGGVAGVDVVVVVVEVSVFVEEEAVVGPISMSLVAKGWYEAPLLPPPP